ncbi:MAG: hypothetical protein RSD95_15150, partial [Clostridia bacterium]
METANTSKQKKLLKPIGSVLFIAILLVVFNLITNNVFVSPRNFTMLLKQSSVLMILASTLMMLLIGRNIDLSGGAGVYFTGTIVAMLIVNAGWPIIPAIALGLVLGVVMGCGEGFFIGYLGLPAFIVTLAFQQIYRGAGYVLTNAATIGPLPKAFNNIAEAFIPSGWSIVLVVALFAVFLMINIVRAKRMSAYGGKGKMIKNVVIAAAICAVLIWMFQGYRGLPMCVVIAFVVALAMHFVSTKTVYGRHIYLIGGNIEAARLAGVRTDRRIFQSYVMEGLIYGIA